MEWKTITINQLKEIVNGATVLESYAINEPFIDGVELVIKKADGKIAIVSFNADSPDPKNIVKPIKPLNVFVQLIPQTQRI